MSEPTLLGGRYELGPLLGRGGMAEVRRARDLRLGRDVAIKRLRVDLATDPTFQARFRREAQAAAGLNHPNIVAVYDTGEEADSSGVMVPYIVMELVEGHTLRELLRTGRQIQPAKALEFTQGVLDALSYSHRAGIVHRDIKPANVMLTSTGVVKVMDFGIARAVADTSATMTQTAAVIGTAQYLSPEQARGETVDARSDIYSAGCLLYELLVGRPPFQGDSPVSVAYQHVREQPVPPSHLDPTLTAGMDAVVLKSLAKSREDRYQSAAAMRADIARILAGQEVTTKVPVAPLPSADEPTVLATGLATATETTGTQTGVATRAIEPPARKRRTWLWVLILSVLAVAAAGGIVWAMNEAGRPQLTEVPSVFEMRQAAAEAALKEAQLVPVVTMVEGPDDTTKDLVVKQSIAPGISVEVGTTVEIQINTGPRMATIPSGLVGQNVDDVVQTLRDLGFSNVIPTADPNEPVTAEADEVTSLQPVEGNTVALDTKITVYYAKGESIVPNFRGLTRARAEQTAKEAGFATPTFTYEESNETIDTVISQNPQFGDVRKRTIKIKLVLAKAPVQTPSPTPTNTSATPDPSDDPDEGD